MKFITKFKKVVSLIVTTSLVISFVIQPQTINAMTNEEATKQYKQIFKDFVLPYSYGQITKAHYAGTDRVVINIQDLHCHPKVQRNISNIIETFDKSYGVNKVYLEGAYGKVDTSWINKKIQEYSMPELLDKMLETGRLTGAEYYSALSGKNQIINGLEEKGPYLENLKRFGTIVENQEKINMILNAMDESLASLKKKYYTKRQYKIEELSKNFSEGKISPQKYYSLLSKHIDKLGIDISKYENTFTYVMLLELQKKLDYSKITTELQTLLLLLKEQFPQAAYQMLLDNTDNFRKIDKLYSYIVQISRLYSLDLAVNFPNLDKYFGYIEFSQKINPLDLIVEEENLTREINTRFSETKAQREIVFLVNFKKYLKDYVTSKITSSDYDYYMENIDTYKQLWNKYVDNRVLSLLDDYMAEADKFYKINNDRNIYFTNNMFKESDVLNKIESETEAKGDVNKIIENMKSVKEIDVVITGGFHSQTVTEILRNHGVSYIVITPNVEDGVKLAEDTYYQIAKEQSKISFQALANLIASLSPVVQQKIFETIDAKEKIQDISELSSEEKIKKLREIVSAKLLESDDEGEVVEKILEIISKNDGFEISEDVLDKIDVEKFKKLQEDIQKQVLDGLQKPTLQKALTIIENTLSTYINFITEKQKENIARKEEIIKQIKSLPNLSEEHKKLLIGRDDRYSRIIKELSEYEYENLENYSEEQLQKYLELTKQLWNISEIKSEEQVRKEIEKSFAKVEMFFSLVGYSAPQGDYEKISLSVLSPLMEKISKILGKERFGILSSPTADKGSIDATSTVLSQMYDALMVYVTAVNYLKYVNPENFPDNTTFEEIEDLIGKIDKKDLLQNGTNLKEFLNAFKFIAQNGDIYSKAVAQTRNVPNFAVIIGGRAVALNNDLINAISAGNEIILVNSTKLAKQSQAPAIDHKKVTDTSTPYILNNSVDYLLNIISLMQKGIINSQGVLVEDSSFEFSEGDKEVFADLEIKKKTLAELRKNKNIKEAEQLEQEIDKIEQQLGSLKIFYNLLKLKGISEEDIKLISLLIENGVKSRKDLEKLKIHVVDMEDGNSKSNDELYKAGETAAGKIFEIIKNFIKSALSAKDMKWVGSVKSAEIEVSAFDLAYAKAHGYLEGVTDEDAKYDSQGNRYYILKTQYDKNKHFTTRIYDTDSDNSTLSARTDVSVNPMFVIYANGNVGFMSREKFNTVYKVDVKENKTVNQLFKATKKEKKVEVSFVDAMEIIDTDEGRDTVLPYDIVVRGENGKPYAMSITEFMRIYPKEKNLEFYEANKEEIEKLLKEASIFNEQREQQESIEQQKGQIQQQSSEKQQIQKNKKINIKNIVASLLLSVVLFFSAFNIGSSLVERNDTITTSPKAVTVVVQEDNTTQITQKSQESFTPVISQEYIDSTWHYFDETDTDYRSSSPEDFKESIYFSNSKEVLDSVQRLKDLLNDAGFQVDNDTKIIFMKGTNMNNNAACACCELNTIVICVNNLSTDNIDSLISLLSGKIPEKLKESIALLEQIAHENTHLHNYGKGLSPLEDEELAINNEITVVDKLMDDEILDMSILEQHNVVVSKPDMRLDTGERVNHVGAMKYFAFKNAVAEQKNVINKFIQAGYTDVSFNNVHYANNGILFAKNDITVKPTESFLNSTEVELILVDDETGAAISYVTDVGIDIAFKPTKEQIAELRINHQRKGIDEQGEITKDGKRTSSKPAKKTTKNSKKKVQQTEESIDHNMTKKEITEILENASINSERVKKSELIFSFTKIAYDLNVSRETFNKVLLPLIKELANRRISEVYEEEKLLAFKILLNEYFRENKQTKTDMTDYEDAIKMSRLLYYMIGDKAADLTEQQINQIIPLLMDTYYKGVEQLYSRNTITENTGFYCLLGEEEDCNKEGWESIFKLLGIESKKEREYFKCTGKSWKDSDIAKAWLDAIRNYAENKDKYGLENIYVMYSGHGQPTYLMTGDYDLKVEDIVEALVDARKKGVDLNEITLDLATCWSYFSSINIIEQLKKRFEEENLSPSFPNIVTDAGYESLKGKFIDMKKSPISIDPKNLASGKLNVTLSNKELSLIKYILDNEIKGKLSLADFHNAERTSANYTVFAVTNEEMESLFESLRQKVFGILDISSDDITYGMKERTITEYMDIYEEHEREVNVQSWLAKKGNMIYMELLLDKTKEILDGIGNTKIIRSIYKDKAGENFKNTRLGKAIGVNLETFAFWMPKFVAAHNFDSSQKSGTKAVVWKIRALSVGIGFGVLPVIISLINPITPVIVIPAIVVTLATANIFHYIYDIKVSSKQQLKTDQEKEDKNATISLVNPTNLDESVRKSGIVQVIESVTGEAFENQKSNFQFKTFEDVVKEINSKRKGLKWLWIRAKQKIAPKNYIGNSFGFSLGLTSYMEKRTYNVLPIYYALSKFLNLCTWGQYEQASKERVVNTEKHIPALFNDCRGTDKKIYMFVPPELFSMSIEDIEKMNDYNFRENEELSQFEKTAGATFDEIKGIVSWLKDHPEDAKYVEFVFGAYDYLNVPDEQFYNEHFKNLSELYRKIFDGEIELSQPVSNYKDREKNNLIENIIAEIRRLTPVEYNMGFGIVIDTLKEENIEDLSILLKFLKEKANVDKNEEKIYSDIGMLLSKAVKNPKLIEQNEKLFGKIPQDIKEELSGTYYKYLETYFEVIKNLADKGIDVNIKNIHNDLYYFVKQYMISSIATSIFESYYNGDTKIIDKAKMLMKYFANPIHNSFDLWFGNENFNFAKEEKLVNRVYGIGTELDEFIKKKNINIKNQFSFSRDIGGVLQEGFSANQTDKYIVECVEKYLTGEIDSLIKLHEIIKKQIQTQQEQVEHIQPQKQDAMSLSDEIKEILSKVKVSLSAADIESISKQISKTTNKYFSITDSTNSNVLEELSNGTANLPEDVLSSLTKLFKLDGSFTAQDNHIIHNYVFPGKVRNETREKQMKFFAVIYSYISWKEKFGNDFETGKTIYVTKRNELGKDITIEINYSFDDWLHTCDAHSILMNGNEEDEARYENSKIAFNSAITLDMLTDNLINNIVNDWDLYSEREENTNFYMKNINGKIYALVMNMKENKIMTTYVIDNTKYQNDYKEIIRTSLADRTSLSDLDSRIRNGKLFFKTKIDANNNIIGTVKFNPISAETKYCIGFENNEFKFSNSVFYDELYKFDVTTRQKIMKIKEKQTSDVKFLTGSNNAENKILMIDQTDSELKILIVEKDKLDDKRALLLFSVDEENSILSINKINDKKLEITFSNNTKFVLNIEYALDGLLYSDDGRVYVTEKNNINIVENVIEHLIETNSSLSLNNKSELKAYISRLFEILKRDDIILPFKKNIINMINSYDKSNLETLINLVETSISQGQKFQAQVSKRASDSISEYIKIFSEMGIDISAQNSQASIQQENKVKETSYQTLMDLIKASINPVQMVIDTMKEMLITNNKYMTGKNLIVDDDVSISDELRTSAMEKGINIVTLKIVTEQEANKRGGKLIDEQNKIRMYFDSNKNELLVYSKQGINVSVDAIKEMISAAYKEGRQDLNFDSEQIVAFAQRTDTTISDIQNRIEIARKYGIIKADTEIKFDLTNEKNINVETCNGEYKSTGANTFVITQDQTESKDISALREKGYRFIVSCKADTISNIMLLDGIQVDAKDLTSKQQAISLLEKLQKMCNVEKTISVEFNENLYKELKGIDIFKMYGVLPLVKADSIGSFTGKKEVKEITDKTNIEKILTDDEIVGVIADSESRNIFSVIKDMLKIKTNVYDKGLNVGLREGHACDISKLKNVLVKGEVKLEDISSLGLQTEDEVYLKYLLEKEKSEEAIGFVIGIAMKNIKQQWETKFTNIDDNLFTKEGKGQYEKGLLLLMLSMQMSGIEIKDLLEEVSVAQYDDRGWNLSAEEMYRIIGEKASVIITRVLNENDKKIKVLSEDEIVKSKEDFKDLNILIQDRFRVQESAQEVKISALAVKSILAAA